MPTLTRWFVRTSLLYLLAALITMLLLALRGLVDLPAFVGALTPVYFHLLIVGWIAQLIFGIVYWMFPKASKEHPRGNERVARSVYFLLNAGLLLRVLGEPMTTAKGGGWGWMLVASAALQWLAGMGFALNTWPRVRDR